MSETDTLVLEILLQGRQFKMSVFEQKELASTVRQYSQARPSFREINIFCQETTRILNKANKKGFLDDDLLKDLRKTGHLFWEHLITRSVKDRLNTTIHKNLILSLDEELINIPWELLYDSNDFLCLKFNLGRLVITREKLRDPAYRVLSEPLKMLILANPTNDLDSAYKEGLNIKRQFEGNTKRVNIDFKSTHIDTVYLKKNLCDYDIVHFAGHCEYDFKNENSGWVLKNGKFSSADILAMGDNLSLPSLVFSNACQSAGACENPIDLDYQRKTYSLASAFLFSGVRHYIGAIRSIEDPVSFVFAKEFYTRLIKGRSVGESIRLSRMELIKEFGCNSIFWASYILYGNPAFSFFEIKKKPITFRQEKTALLDKKSLKKFVITIVVILAVSFFYVILPVKNPSTYFLFQKAKRLLLKGKNKEVISECSSIIKKEPMFLAVYPQIAVAYQREGKRQEALKYYFEYAVHSQKKQDKKNLASAYTGIAWIYHQMGEYPKAYDLYNKALAIGQENKDNLNQAIAMRKLAVWYIDNGNNDKALELLTKSSEINRERKHSNEHKFNLACDYFDMGLLFFNKDDYVTAKEFYTKSKGLFEKMSLRNELSDCYFNLGEIYLFEKNYQKALDYYAQGLKIDQIQNNLPNLSGDYNMIGELYLDMDDLEKAQNYFLQASGIARQINAQSELALVNYNLGVLYKKKRQKNKARECFRQAQEFYSVANLPEYQKVKKELLDLDS